MERRTLICSVLIFLQCIGEVSGRRRYPTIKPTTLCPINLNCIPTANNGLSVSLKDVLNTPVNITTLRDDLEMYLSKIQHLSDITLYNIPLLRLPVSVCIMRSLIHLNLIDLNLTQIASSA